MDTFIPAKLAGIAPAPTTIPNIYGGNGGWRLPDGQLVRTTKTSELKQEMRRLGIPHEPDAGRQETVDRYAAYVAELKREAGEKAFAAWLEANRP